MKKNIKNRRVFEDCDNICKESYWLSLLFFFTNFSKIRGVPPPSQMPLTVNIKWHFIRESDNIKSRPVFEGRAKHLEIFYLNPQTCPMMCSAFFCFTIQRVYFFWICDFVLMILSFCLFFCIKVMYFSSQIQSFLILNWYQHSDRIPKYFR